VVVGVVRAALRAIARQVERVFLVGLVVLGGRFAGGPPAVLVRPRVASSSSSSVAPMPRSSPVCSSTACVSRSMAAMIRDVDMSVSH
jgi:hypothetical protein